MATHEQIESNLGLLIVFTILTQICRGGLLEIVPLFSRNPRRPRLRA